MSRFKQLIDRAKAKGPVKIAVACAHDDDVLKALRDAAQLGIVSGFLVGDEAAIRKIAEEISFDYARHGFEIVPELNMAQAASRAVTLVSSGRAQVVMKGLVDTAIILKAVLNKETGLRTGNVLSHVALFDVPTYHKFLIVTDAAMNIAPDANGKKQIIENALAVTRALGIDEPNVGVICAKEKVSESMPATMDAGVLTEMAKNGEITGCKIGGPFALDNAISREAAAVKGIKDPMAGDVDILLMPTIEAGNVLYKALNFMANALSAGVIVGAKAPIVLTSRADSEESKLYSIALAVLMG